MKIFAIIIVACALGFYALIKVALLAQIADYTKKIAVALEKIAKERW